jgi:hypothetical protein
LLTDCSRAILGASGTIFFERADSFCVKLSIEVVEIGRLTMTLRDLAGWILHRRSTAVEVPDVVEEISRDEVVAIIETLAKQRRGISAHELLSSYRDGTLKISADVMDLLVYADLLSQDDPIFSVESSSRTRPEAQYAHQ